MLKLVFEPIRWVSVLIATLAGFLFVPIAHGNTVDPLFQDQGALSVELTAPLSSLVRERSESEDLPGTFSYREADGTRVELDIQVRARGNFRHRNCDFPPVTLNFRRSQVEGTLFAQQNKLKMVTHCKITRRYEQGVVREYLAYRMLNALTDLSFNVRLLNVTWVDSEGRKGRMVRSAFLIEHKNRLAARTGLAEQEIERAELASIRPDHLNLASMFQYLIGNVDFSPLAGSEGTCCHNYSMHGKSVDELVAIPFDFDLAGIVNAPYAEPDRELGIERQGQRLYRGYCANNGHLERSISEFRTARDTLFALVARQEELEPNVRESMARYMDEFYEVIDDPEKVDQQMTGRCI